MAIKPFQFTGAAQPQQPTPQISPEQAAMQQNASAQVASQQSQFLFQVANQQAGHAAGIKVQSDNMDMQAKIAQRDVLSMYNSENVLGAIAKGSSAVQIRALQTAEAQRLDQLPLLEKEYITNNSIKLQENFLNASNELQKNSGPRGEGYLEGLNRWFNDEALRLLDEAPSDESKQAMFDRIMTQKLHATADAIEFEKGRTIDYTVNQSNSAAESLVRQALMNPENLPAYIEQVGALKETMIEAGMDPNRAEQWLTQSKNSIAGSFMQRQIMDDPVRALTLLATSDVGDVMSADSFVSTFSHAMNATKKLMEQQKKEMDVQHAMAKVDAGIPMNPNSSDDRKAVDSWYEASTAQMRDPETGLFNQPPQVVAEYMNDLFQKNKSFLPEKFKGEFYNSITQGTPAQIEAYSNLIAKMASDINTAPMIKDLDKNAVQEAMYVNRARAVGTPIEKAVEYARNNFRDVSDPVKNARREAIRKDLTNDKIADDIEGEFSSWLAPVVAFGYKLMGEGDPAGITAGFWNPDSTIAHETYHQEYSLAFQRTGDADLAKEFALKQLHRQFGSTTINGQNEIMPYAPSVVFPGREQDFRNTLFKTINPEVSDLTERPQIEVDGVMRDWKISHRSQDGVNFAQLHKAYPLYYVDENGFDQPLLDNQGFQRIFIYKAGATLQEAEAAEHARQKQIAGQKVFAEKQKLVLDAYDLISKDRKQHLTPEQAAMIDHSYRQITNSVK